YSAADGKLVWSKSVNPTQLEEFHRSDGSPAAATPATDGKHVVSYFGSFGVVAYDTKGKELWQYPMPVAQTIGGYGSGTSPLLVGDHVVINRDVLTNASLVSINLQTGKKEWECSRPGNTTSYGTPVLWKNNGVDEVITPGCLILNGYDLKSGKIRWT